MILGAKKRRILMERLYRRSVLGPEQVYGLINQSLKNKAISVIRLGDVMAKLLSKRDLSTLKKVAPFLGIPYPPGANLLSDLDRSVRLADVVGVTYFPRRARQLVKFMKKRKWNPTYITDSFINDLMYDRGYLHALIRDHRVALVGRSAKAAAKKLKKQNLHIELIVDLNHYDHLREAYSVLKKNKDKWDIALVGASVPGRILCVALTKQLNKTSFEIGHMMDALAHPKQWKKHHDRAKFKKRWIQKLDKKIRNISFLEY
ncbi:GT-D fold domain-containing glycosyltransferase [Ammoniphilus resinae]|uniref:GT-D fold-like domain-containing protein n=1 Tax=Ammoniphilus resinae TaxID=861532 RepID=A0ABS4GKY5_9BACL|nr:GT-D fold domain-containing glycosyltransferase [Ammoniphilus resinae]MBP1930928.1 hypothetical protein [Ammoniphilus resinae]